MGSCQHTNQRADVDWVALRKRANYNLGRLMDGSIRREEAHRRAAERRAKERRKQERRELTAERRELRTNITEWRREIETLRSEFQYLYDAYENGTINEGGPGEDMGALEEVDHRIDTLIFKLADAEERLMFVNDWLRR